MDVNNQLWFYVTQWQGRGVECTFTLSLTSALDGGVVNARARPIYPPGNTQYIFYRRLGGPQGRSGRVWKILTPTEIRSQDRPARSESLYRLSYPDSPAEHSLSFEAPLVLRKRLAVYGTQTNVLNNVNGMVFVTTRWFPLRRKYREEQLDGFLQSNGFYMILCTCNIAYSDLYSVVQKKHNVTDF